MATETGLLNRHMAKVMILKLLIIQANHWTFESDERLPPEDRQLLRDVRDDYVKQLEGNLKFAEQAARK
jgi:hypothetical protein